MSDSYSQAFMKNKKASLGQNFLRDKQTINKFIEFCQIDSKDIILEIGPGKGALTKLITNKAKRVICIELDTKLANYIKLRGWRNIKVINNDFLKLDLKDTIQKKSVTKIIGAIPYYISSPIIHKILQEAVPPLREVCLITQKEFAEKVIPLKGNKKRSYFTNLIELYANLTTGGTINKKAFYPIPKVDSFYFKFKFKKYPKNEMEVKKWSVFLHHIFKNPRKKINKKFKKEVLETLGISENLRPQNLSIEEIKKLKYNLYHD